MAIAKAPRIGRKAPESDNSPAHSNSAKCLASNCPLAAASVGVSLSSATDNHERVIGAVRSFFDFVDRDSMGYKLIFESDVLEPVVQERVDELAEHIDIQEVVLAQVAGPGHGQQPLAQARTAVELHAVALAVVKAQRLHVGVVRQGPGQARGGILSSRKEDQRAPAHAAAGAGGVRMVRTMAASITP